MTSATQAEGRAWEALAAKYLARHGLTIIDRGYHCRAGEIDLVCQDKNSLVIVEVRARASSAHGSAAATVSARKRRKIITATRHYLMRHPQWFEAPVRFDVVAIDATRSQRPRLQWIRNAFDGN